MTMNQTKNNDKTQPGDRSQAPVVSALPDSGRKETSSPWIEKYEMGSGKDKINVRIFKEPKPEPIVP